MFIAQTMDYIAKPLMIDDKIALEVFNIKYLITQALPNKVHTYIKESKEIKNPGIQYLDFYM